MRREARKKGEREADVLKCSSTYRFEHFVASWLRKLTDVDLGTRAVLVLKAIRHILHVRSTNHAVEFC